MRECIVNNNNVEFVPEGVRLHISTNNLYIFLLKLMRCNLCHLGRDVDGSDTSNVSL